MQIIEVACGIPVYKTLALSNVALCNTNRKDKADRFDCVLQYRAGRPLYNWFHSSEGHFG